ncbi:MAG TPA: N-acetylmuramoyl-L-alanine amidase [Candidatus Acidoferrales bacterium]|nr:N-acetylmuramoyl-L-alanine amidase [Candidatus Acidoferrales bacterium]
MLSRRSRRNLGLAILLASVLLSVVQNGFAQNKRLTIYSVQTAYSVDVLAQNGVDYVGLVDVLEPVGHVESHVEGDHVRLKFNNADCDFENGKTQARIRNANLDLGANFLVLNQHGYVPLSSVPALLRSLTGKPNEFHAAARRLFMGVQPTVFKAELQRNPSRLVLTFASPVAPSVIATSGRVRLLFSHEPIIPFGNESSTYGDALISSTSSREINGAFEFTANVAQPASVNYAESGRQVIITASTNAAAAQPSAQKQPETPLPPPHFDRPAPPKSKFLVVIDPAHGGTDNGDAITPDLAEKNVTLALARRLARDLETRGIASTLLRTSDIAISLDQRANSANTARPAVYVSLHASSQGNGVRVYTSMLTVPSPPPDRRSFLPWETAQAAWLDVSNSLAAAVNAACASKSLPVRSSPAPVRPLNNIAAPAFAIEIASPADNPAAVNSGRYQDVISAAIAQAIADSRAHMEVTQ